MTTIANTNERYGDCVEVTGTDLADAVARMQEAIRGCGPEFADVVVTEGDYEVVDDTEDATTYSGNWRDDAHCINGQTGCAYDLAAWVESKGFEVRPDTDNNERSLILRPGAEDAGDREIGEILGDEDAKVVIWETT